MIVQLHYKCAKYLAMWFFERFHAATDRETKFRKFLRVSDADYSDFCIAAEWCRVVIYEAELQDDQERQVRGYDPSAGPDWSNGSPSKRSMSCSTG